GANPALIFSDKNLNRAEIVRVIRAIAYDADYFTRCASLLQRFLASEKERDHDSVLSSIKSLFWLYLSGTHAPLSQRRSFVSALLMSGLDAEQELGLTLLGELLKAAHFSNTHSFEFGAWKRDYGLHPASRNDVHTWFATVIEMSRS